MTIIEPIKNQYRFNLFIVFLSLFLIGLAVFGIYLYNQNVALRHAINDHLRQAQTLKVANADWQNLLYQALDPEAISVLAEKRQLIAEKNPKYLESGGEALASNR